MSKIDMSIELSFIKQRDGGWEFKVKTFAGSRLIDDATCWRRGSQSSIKEYYAKGYGKRVRESIPKIFKL